MPIGVNYSPPIPPPPPLDDLPGLSLQVAWDAAVTDPVSSLVWEDLTPRVRSISSTSGRQRDLDRIEAARMDVTLSDDDHLLDAANPASPLYGRLRPLARARWRETWAGVTYDLHTGYLRKVSHARADLDSFLASLECVDASTWLNQVPTESSPWMHEMMADRPVHLWRIGSGERVIADSGSQPQPLANLYVTAGSAMQAVDGTTAQRVVGDPSPGGSFDGATSLAWGPISLPTGSWTLEVPFSLEQDTLGPSQFAVDANPVYRTIVSSSVNGMIVGAIGPETGYQAGSIALYALNLRTGYRPTLHTAKDCADGRPHLLIVTYDASTGRISLRVDDDTYTYDTVANLPRWGPLTFGASGNYAPAYFGWKGELGTAAIFDGVLSDARIIDHYYAWRNAWAGDTPGQRIGRLLDIAGVPAADRDIETGSCTLGPAKLGQSVLTHCDEVAGTDEGAFFVDGSGRYVYHGREHIFAARAATVQQTYTDVDDVGAVAYDLPLELPLDDTYLWNRAEVTREGGSAQRAEDTTAQGRDGVRLAPERSGLLLADDDQAYSAAHRQLDRSLTERITSLTCLPMRSPEVLWPRILGARIGDRLAWTHRPETATYHEELTLQGISHTLTVGEDPEWRTELAVSRAPDITRYTVLDQSDLDDGSVLF